MYVHNWTISSEMHLKVEQDSQTTDFAEVILSSYSDPSFNRYLVFRNNLTVRGRLGACAQTQKRLLRHRLRSLSCYFHG
jgi:hypothetical protein